MYAVFDVEATGLRSSSDRIIEIGLIGLDAEGEFEWEWCSLINPERDTGSGLARRVHQIYPRDVAQAPTFRDISGHIAELIRGRCLIAHNVRFDIGMLHAEFERLGVHLPAVMTICTAEMARDCGFNPWGLAACCDLLGIHMDSEHHALADARAAWQLARHIFDFRQPLFRREVAENLRAQPAWPALPMHNYDPVVRPIVPRRPSTDARPHAPTVNPARAVPVLEEFDVERETPETRYLAAVERFLEDRVISPEQTRDLAKLKAELQMTDAQIDEVHTTFLRGLAGSMWSDGEISAHEKFDLEVVRKALGLSEDELQNAIENPLSLDLINPDYRLQPGTKVVFTGEMSIRRSQWTERAKAAGLRVTNSVSRKTDLLVVPFGETGSGKSLKARELGVRVVTEQRFIRMIRHLE